MAGNRRLNKRQREIALLRTRGLTYQKIADHYGVCVSTVMRWTFPDKPYYYQQCPGSTKNDPTGWCPVCERNVTLPCIACRARAYTGSRRPDTKDTLPVIDAVEVESAEDEVARREALLAAKRPHGNRKIDWFLAEKVHLPAGKDFADSQ
jgi:hypothetical protein